MTVNVDGTITYSPDSKFVGSVSFRYFVKDNAGDTSNEATVTVDVAKAPPGWQNSRNRLDVNDSNSSIDSSRPMPLFVQFFVES